MIRFRNLLEMSLAELESLIVEQLKENPALEKKVKGNPFGEIGHFGNSQSQAVEKISVLDWDGWEEFLDLRTRWRPKQASLEEHLLWQLRLSRANHRDTAIGLQIVQNLDENAYLAVSLEEVCKKTGVTIDATLEEVAAVHSRILFFDPVGVAARDLRECPLTQLENLDLAGNLAARIVADFLGDLESKQYEKLAHELGVPINEIHVAVNLIASLEAKPSHWFEQNDRILCDVFVKKMAGDCLISLNNDGMLELRVCSLYQRLANIERSEGTVTQRYLQKKVREARWLIEGIRLRRKTLLRVARSIFKFQGEFLDYGTDHLKPLSPRDVAADVHLHESSVSRAVANKYVHTPQGLFSLDFFFKP